jgi:hypothetical protein
MGYLTSRPGSEVAWCSHVPTASVRGLKWAEGESGFPSPHEFARRVSDTKRLRRQCFTRTNRRPLASALATQSRPTRPVGLGSRRRLICAGSTCEAPILAVPPAQKTETGRASPTARSVLPNEGCCTWSQDGELMSHPACLGTLLLAPWSRSVTSRLADRENSARFSRPVRPSADTLLTHSAEIGR